ncbi:MAG: VTC domain-containing protein [Gammaproteobacteria bacterium]
MSYRKEKKFRLTSYDAIKVIADLKKKGMKELYPKRVISSQYFDNSNCDMFLDSEEGLLPRKKIRVRWYNQLTENLSLEEKTSSIEGRFKVSKKINIDNFEKIKKFGFIHHLYGKLSPSVLIKYEREYFLFEEVRVTFDSNIRYQHHGSNLWFKDFERVAEIKVPINAPDDFLENIFPVPTSRFSKYARSFLLKNKNL